VGKNMTIKITPIGTCRIHNPLKKFISKSYLQLNTADIYGFIHTSAEALQQIKYLQGDYLPSKGIHPILSSRLRFNKSELKQKSLTSDLYFVEISSAKTVFVDNEYVQMNYIYVHFSEFFLEPSRARKFWSLAAHSDKEELLTFLQETPCYKTYPKEKQELLSKISVKHMTEYELRRDMMEINNRLPNVIFITHCNVKLPDMTSINSREKWIKTIEKIGKEIGCKVYNPTHLMTVLGQSVSLQKNGLDSTHYTSLFERQIFNDLHRLYIEPLSNGFFKTEEIEDDKNWPIEELNHIDKLHDQGEMTLVLQQLNNLMRKYSKFSPAKELFGRILYQLNDYERAIEILNVLDEKQELSNEGRFFLIKSCFNLKLFKDVLNNTDLLFEEEIYEPEVIKLSAIASQSLGDADRASIHWEQLYKFENFKFEAASQLALLFEQINDFDKAIKWINLALEISPTDVNLRSALNRMLATVSDEKCLELLIEQISPISEEEIISIARTILNHHFILPAAKILRKAQELWPNNLPIKKMIAKITAEWLTRIMDSDLSQTHPEQWLNYLSGLLLIQPRQNSAIRIRREYILNQRTQLKDAYKNSDYDKAIAAGMNVFLLDPNFPGIPLLIGRSFYAKRNYSQALEWLNKATALDNSDKNLWLLKAKVALKANNFIEALSTVQKIKSSMTQADQSMEIKNTIKIVIRDSLKEVNILIQKDELEQAWQINEALLAHSPGEKKILKTKILILRRMSEYLKDSESSEIQIKLAKSIHEKDPNNIQALRILAVGLMKQKKLEESLLYWDKLCILFPEINSYKMQAQKCIKSEVAV
jgi:tetratricopeptide (TPR) repeat protein